MEIIYSISLRYDTSEEEMIIRIKEMHTRLENSEWTTLCLYRCSLRDEDTFKLFIDGGLRGVTILRLYTVDISLENFKTLLEAILDSGVEELDFICMPEINLFPGEMKAILKQLRKVMILNCDFLLTVIIDGECYPRMDDLSIFENHPVETFPLHMNRTFPNLRRIHLKGLGLTDIKGFTKLEEMKLWNNPMLDNRFWTRFLQRYMEFPSIRRFRYGMFKSSNELRAVYDQFLSQNFKNIVYLWEYWDGLPKDLIRQLGLYIVASIATN